MTRTTQTEPTAPPTEGGGRREPRGGGWGVWAAIIAIVAAGVLGPSIWAAIGDEWPAVDEGATAREILADPDEFAGETVAVSGEVEAVLGENAFTIAGAEEGLLVVTPNLPAQVTSGSVVQASGPVRTYAVTEFEDDLGVELVDELFAEFGGQPAVAAEDIDVSVVGEAAPPKGTSSSASR